MVEIKKELLGPCGLYCGVCAVYIAHRDNNRKFKERIVNVYKPYTKSVEDVQCSGCLSEDIENIFGWCQICPIKSCVKEKGIESCHECNEYPCKYIKKFPMPVGRKVIKRAIPFWREYGTEKYVEAEIERYHCPECGNPLFRGAKRCNKCNMSVDVD